MPLDADKIFGSLLGLVLADALGARFEGMRPEAMHEKFGSKSAAFEYALLRDSLRYTDDGQMTLALTEYLTKNPRISSDDLMRSFVRAYESWRGYGRGARVLIEAFRDDAEYEFMAEHLFPGGSLGNGAAMRSAPVGLRYIGDTTTIWNEAKNSAWPTHRHELGIEGAQLIALATSLAAGDMDIGPRALAEALLPSCATIVFQNRLKCLAEVVGPDDIAQFGNGIEAHESVVTALACFALYPTDFQEAAATAFWQGGDTDTIGAMTGALVGARVGSGIASSMPLDRLEEGQDFIAYLQDLANRLAAMQKLTRCNRTAIAANDLLIIPTLRSTPFEQNTLPAFALICLSYTQRFKLSTHSVPSEFFVVRNNSQSFGQVSFPNLRDKYTADTSFHNAPLI